MLTCCDYITWNRRVVKGGQFVHVCVEGMGEGSVGVAVLLYVLAQDRDEWPT